MIELFALFESGHLKPITPMKVSPFEDLPAAFHYMRGGNHLGKIVISSGVDHKAEVPVCAAKDIFCPAR